MTDYERYQRIMLTVVVVGVLDAIAAIAWTAAVANHDQQIQHRELLPLVFGITVLVVLLVWALRKIVRP